MYTLLITLFFVSRKRSRRANFRSAHNLFSHLAVFLSKHCADRFLLWWLFLHRRLRPRQRGSSCDERLLLSSRWFLAEKFFPFLSGKPEKVFQPFLEQSLSASIQSVIVTFFPSFCYSRTMRHRSARLSLYRSKARKH